MCRPEAEIEDDLDVMFDQGVLSKKRVSLPALQKQLPKSKSGHHHLDHCYTTCINHTELHVFEKCVDCIAVFSQYES
jgi:hypothetical protein